jgi:hypothetical protein
MCQQTLTANNYDEQQKTAVDGSLHQPPHLNL